MPSGKSLDFPTLSLYEAGALMKINFLLAAFAALFSPVLDPLHASAEIVAAGELPADARDQFGDTVGGIGSGVIYDATTDTLLCIPDRGAGDGTIPFRPRYIVLKATKSGEKLDLKVVESILFRDEEGREMTGLIPDDPEATTPRMKDGRTCIDPEAIAIAPDGTLYVTNEYGPDLYQFQRDGKLIRRIAMPEWYRPKTAADKIDFTAEAQLATGRNINQGAEGMALMPDGKTVALAFQSGLMQDGGHASPLTRILLLDLQSGEPVEEYYYPIATHLPGTDTPLKPDDLSVNDLIALDAHTFLILERDRFGRTGTKTPTPAAFKAVWLVDTSKATNLLKKSEGTPTPVTKTLLFNLPALVKDPGQLAAKWEGMALLAPVKDGKYTLMMTADNDFLTPEVHQDGKVYPFPRAEDAVPTQFFEISGELPQS